jgi:hypothetical protein
VWRIVYFIALFAFVFPIICNILILLLKLLNIIIDLAQLFTPVIVKLVSNDREEPRDYEEDRL